jgi:hypothetical protein
MKKAIYRTMTIRNALGRFLQTDLLFTPKLSFEMRETVRHCEDTIHLIGTGGALPPWSAPYQILEISDSWREKQVAAAAAGLVAAIVDKTGLHKSAFMPDEWTYFTILRDSLIEAGYMKEWVSTQRAGYGITSYNRTHGSASGDFYKNLGRSKAGPTSHPLPKNCNRICNRPSHSNTSSA